MTDTAHAALKHTPVCGPPEKKVPPPIGKYYPPYGDTLYIACAIRPTIVGRTDGMSLGVCLTFSCDHGASATRGYIYLLVLYILI